jgi:putative cell wall-binding protein
VTATKRFTGADRYVTANAVANHAATNTQGKFVLVNGNSFADGLSASALAGALGSALLLTEAAATPASVLATMTSMSGAVAGVNKHVYIVGGTSAVSAAQETSLKNNGWNVTRISGANRYATADAVAAAVKTQNGGATGTIGGYKTAFLASGLSFADAITVSGMAYDHKLPIYLTDGTTLSAGTAAAMKAQGIQKVIGLGGTAVISDAVMTAALGVSTVAVTQRLSGSDRYGTAKAVADAMALLDATRKVKAILVDGRNFPDGLAASQWSANQDATILLTNGSTLPTDISAWLTSRQANITTISTIGGTTAVPAATVTAAKTAATIPGLTATFSKVADGSTTYTVTFSGRVTEATAETAANHVHTFKNGGTETAAGMVYTYSATTGVSKVVVTQPTAMAPGDSLTVKGGSIADFTTAAVKVGMASFTVTANAVAPTVAIYAESGSANDVAKTAYFTFSTAITGFDAGGTDVTVTDQVVGGTAAAVDTCAIVTGTFTYTCNDKAGDGALLVAGDTVAVGAGKVTSTATTGVKNLAGSTVVVHDVTAPVMTSISYTAPVAATAQASQASLRVIGKNGVDGSGAAAGQTIDASAGDIIIQVKAGTALAGRAGNAVKLHVDIDAAGANACSYNASTKTVSVVATAVTIKAPTIVDICNANSTFKDLFIASSVFVAGTYALTAMADSAVAAGYALTGGEDSFTMTVNFSEPVIDDVDNETLTCTTNNGTTIADAKVVAKTSSVVEKQQKLNGTLMFTVSVGTAQFSGLDKCTIDTAADVKDRAGNTVSVAGTTHIVKMFLG